ncbi:siderophore-interacting protein [Brevibacterium jeotgali]|uniref:NADPH-dependent ferric siderophore reductase, contains FAD-binding and SIP domains n=1 Tax=Brevibacterium jeotgali TaxID=1262550 RepID=A0A2H1L3R8_9MICO|nr:siderophore-interacting protein [Brevibacterium jeotgali]TWC01786.1 NADPH-dependent ferric siderophore reductase [Brevibacterium jeotgali]SMY11531.1 NADPH-dependent ferric siderophore reductase, contains FAD-binding and SIP domains [Brevibacterium jeotgali]
MAPRSAYRPFAVTLTRRTRLSDTFYRLTFTGPELAEFADTCLDQRIKLVFGTDAQLDEAAAADDWATWWREQPNESRPTMRTYTARYVRRDAREVDVDFVTHGSEGPASRFALTAEPGDRLVIVGAYADHPEADTQGLAWRRDGAPSVLLVGDETAQPAIANILRSLPAHVSGAAFVEVPSPGDAMEMVTDAEVAVSYLPRSASDERGSLLASAVFAWADERAEGAADGSAAGTSGHGSPSAGGASAAGSASDDEDATTTETGILWEEGAAGPGLRVWVAADAQTVRELRRGLLRERGYDRKSCSFMGYWKQGSREGE